MTQTVESRFTGALFPFQSELVVGCVARPCNILVADAGTGKSIMALAAASLLFDMGEIDKVILVCEQNKLTRIGGENGEWQSDIARTTNLSVNVYHGPRRKLSDADVLLTTYATFVGDALASKAGMPYLAPMAEGFLGKRVLIIADEAAILGSSCQSVTYKTFQTVLDSWRERAQVRMLAMTATPMTTTPENYYNLADLLIPGMLGTRREFYRRYVTKYDKFHRPSRFRDLDDLEARLNPILLRKAKTDDDVVGQFPKMIEEAVYIDPSPEFSAAYEEFDNLIAEITLAGEATTTPAFKALTAFVAHPSTALQSGWKLQQDWVESYGQAEIEALPHDKVEALRRVIAQRTGGIIVFSDSTRVLELLADELGVPVVLYHGGRSAPQNAAAREQFASGAVRVMLTSSKGERGINLPQASTVVNYTIPTTHAAYVQRANRASRIGHNLGGEVAVVTLVTRRTIEQAAVTLWLLRNQWSDALQDPHPTGVFTTAFDRRVAHKISRHDEPSTGSVSPIRFDMDQ